MSYLLRVVLPDRPGMLGAVDDLLVSLPPGGLADTLITSAQSVPGVVVESLRPYHGGQELHRDLELVEQLAAKPAAGLELLVQCLPGVFRAGWAVLLTKGPTVVESSPGAPGLNGLSLPWLPLGTGRRLSIDDPWVPERWRALGTELVAAPVGAPDRAVLVGRTGGPAFRDSEVLRLAHLAGIAATVTAADMPS